MYLSLGMKLTKIERILKFKPFEWLKNTLILIQIKEKNAANSSERGVFLTDE